MDPTDAEALKLKYEKIATNTKRHHWVPKFYLGYFAHSQKNGQKYVYMYQPNTEPQLVNTINIAAEKDLYTFRQADGEKTRVIEGVFSEHEGRVKEILDNVISRATLPANEADLDHIATFVAMLRTRGPFMTEWLKNMDVEHQKLITQFRVKDPERLAREFAQAGVTLASQEKFEEMRRFMADPSRYTIDMKNGEEHYFKQAMELSKDMYRTFMTDKSWHLLVAPKKRDFVTSDNPVVIQEIEECPQHLASGILNGTVLLPLCPRLCLALRRIPLRSKKVFLSEQDTDHINRSVIMAARKQIYGPMSSKRVQSLCDQYLSGKASDVTVTKMVEWAPFYMTRNAPQQKEAQGIRKNSRPIG